MSVEYNVPNYDTVPDALDMLDDIFVSIQQNCQKPIAEKLRENDSINGSLVYRQVLSASLTEVAKVMNIIGTFTRNVKIAERLDDEQKHVEAQF